jgi:hypothetical protein
LRAERVNIVAIEGPAADERRARRRAHGRRRRLDRLGEHRLDRRREADGAPVLADARGDRPDDALDACAVGAEDRRPGEPRADPGCGDCRAGDADEDPRALDPLAVEEIEDLHVEARDRRPLHDGERRAAGAHLHLRQRHDRVRGGGARGRDQHAREGGEEQAAHATRQ